MIESCALAVGGLRNLAAQGGRSTAMKVSVHNPVMDTDLNDVEASLRGDDDAFARLIGRYQPQVFKQMWRFSRDAQAVEELVQDVFVEVFKSLKGFRGDAPFLHWTRKIATRVGYRYWKRNARQRRLQQELGKNYVEVVSNPETRPSSEAAESLFRILATLSPKDRLVLTLIYFEECTTAEAAARTGWSETLVRVRAHRARQRLRKKLDELRQVGASDE